MRLHFFTVNDIEDYRKNYHDTPLIKKILEETRPQTPEDLDQEFFLRLAKSLQERGGFFDSEIYGDTGIDGLRLDFNFGLRLDVPDGNFRVKISDFDSGQIFFDKYISGGRLISVERYFIRWHVEIFLDDRKIFSHTLDLEAQPVAVVCKFEALGDMLALMPYFAEFKRVHRCDLSVCLPKIYRELYARLYPEINLVDEINFETYATYYPGMIMSPYPIVPVDTRRMSMTQAGGMIFGTDYLPPKNSFKPTAPPVTDEPYVCIAVQSNIARKCWLWPNGRDIVVDYLKSLGYRVFCIDREEELTTDGFTIRRPAGAEDFTGNRPLLERANMLSHAEFFIGLGSGLSWLAYTVDCPVVMICGFSQDWCEFYTPYRVANRKVCNGCFNDFRAKYLDKEPCPYHKNTPRALECQKKISPRMVINAIERLIVDRNLTPPALRRNSF